MRDILAYSTVFFSLYLACFIPPHLLRVIKKAKKERKQRKKESKKEREKKQEEEEEDASVELGFLVVAVSCWCVRCGQHRGKQFNSSLDLGFILDFMVGISWTFLQVFLCEDPVFFRAFAV